MYMMKSIIRNSNISQNDYFYYIFDQIMQP